jgi:hypothetical protein
MEGRQDIPAKTQDSLSELDPSVLENANTITKWLLSQLEEAQPE